MKNTTIHHLLTTIFCCTLLALSSSAFAAETKLEKSSADGSKAILAFAAAPLKTMTETPFSVVLTGPTGVLVKDAAVHIKLDMPAMPMPPNNPKATWQQDAYHGSAIFTMAGAWQAFVMVQRPGYEPQQFVFEIEEVMMK